MSTINYLMRLSLVGFVTAVGLGGIELANGATFSVGLDTGYDFDSIQTGIDATSDRDMVLVAPGEYVITEPITFRGKAITVRSETGRDETTIRMGIPADINHGSVVIFDSGETSASVLDGFTITGGVGSWVSSENTYTGGGIFFDASSGTVRNCAIVQNTSEQGGGIFCAHRCTPILIDCIIAENLAEDSAGGVFAWSGSSPILTNCIIRNNSAELVGSYGGVGGGLLSYVNSSIIMTNCSIVNNVARVGGGLFCGINSSVIMTHCTVIANEARKAAGGIEIYYNSSAAVDNCIFAQNTAVSSCGAMNCSLNGGSATVMNSIFWENIAPKAPEILIRSGGKLDIIYSNVIGGQAGVIVEGGTLNWGQGNIDTDPYFVDPTNDDFHLKSQAGRRDLESQTWLQDDVTSPCIDAGDPMSPIGWEPFPNGGFVNMGAYGGTPEASKTYFGEPVCETIIAGDINGDCKVDRADLEIMALHWTDNEPLPLPQGL